MEKKHLRKKKKKRHLREKKKEKEERLNLCILVFGSKLEKSQNPFRFSFKPFGRGKLFGAGAVRGEEVRSWPWRRGLLRRQATATTTSGACSPTAAATCSTTSTATSSRCPPSTSPLSDPSAGAPTALSGKVRSMSAASSRAFCLRTEACFFFFFVVVNCFFY